jgi:hypothetical protein
MMLIVSVTVYRPVGDAYGLEVLLNVLEYARKGDEGKT